MTTQNNDTSVTDVQFREVPAEQPGKQPGEETTAAGKSLTEQAGYSTNMKASHKGLPEDFDYAPQSIAKIAMKSNDTHPDMIGACRALLVAGGVPNEHLAIFDNHFLINAARGKSILAQRNALNSFWTVQFAMFGTEGFGPRQLLVSVGGDEDWIKWFKTQPLDFIISKGLPVSMIETDKA